MLSSEREHYKSKYYAFKLHLKPEAHYDRDQSGLRSSTSQLNLSKPEPLPTFLSLTID